MSYEHDALIGQFSHDRHRPRSDDALKTLRKIASLVKPIMRQRGWRVGTLAEFYPEQRNLLGVNHNRGSKICLRLRYPSDENQFLPIEEVTDTMLHELAHNIHGPHNQQFHALWDQLRDEHEALLRKGYTGEGFLSQGRRLGGMGGNLEEARRQARAAATRRRHMAGLAAGSGQRLGGRAASWNEDIREVIAGAASRRNTITQGCGEDIPDDETKLLVDAATKNGFITSGDVDEADQRAMMQAYMELVQEEEKERLGSSYVPVTAQNPAGSRSRLPAAGTKLGSELPRPPPVPIATKPIASTDTSSPGPSSRPLKHDGWACPVCTLFNQPNHLCCDACGSERPASTWPTEGLDIDRTSEGSNKRPRSSATNNSTSGRSKASKSDDSRVLKPRTNQETIDQIYAAADAQKLKPIGWLCTTCGNFVEQEWWTCAKCGNMRTSS